MSKHVVSLVSNTTIQLADCPTISSRNLLELCIPFQYSLGVRLELATRGIVTLMDYFTKWAEVAGKCAIGAATFVYSVI